MDSSMRRDELGHTDADADVDADAGYPDAERDINAEILAGGDEYDDLHAHEKFVLSSHILEMFTKHAEHLRVARQKRKQELAIKPIVSTNVSTALAVVGENEEHRPEIRLHAMDSQGEVDLAANVQMGPGDQYEGDLVLRRLNLLLERIDARGYQRSRQQVRFHDAFIRATSRVMFRSDWQSSRPAIMKKYEWNKAPSEILISTPRRFGKTFS
jgi:hypothetical protein